MSSGRRGFRSFKNNVQVKKDIGDDETNPIIICFRKYAKELDDKHDRYERILKLGRDITIESKRIIFLLHTIDPRKGNIENVLKEAEKRLNALCVTNFQQIAKELGNLDPYQYARAYSSGLQEFVEAYTFYEYLSNRKTSDWDDLQKKLNYEISVKEGKKNNDETNKNESKKEDNENKDSSENNEEKDNDSTKEDYGEKEENNTELCSNKEVVKKYSCLVQPIEFICGLADVGGEIMRRSINSLGSGDVETCFELCRKLQDLYTGYLYISKARSRELSRKVYTLKQSVLKVEKVCYNVKVCGSEAAKWGSMVEEKQNADEDEGFF